jgi:Skp family chaperone for outer membrane proteins
MNKIGWQHVLLTLLACVATAASVLFYMQRSNRKIAVVDAVQLFNAYGMKQEMEARSDAVLRRLGAVADSLQQELTAKSRVKDYPRAELAALLATSREAQARLEQTYQETNKEINEQVWKRLNPLIDEYGKSHGLHLVIGANGMGSVLFHDDYYDHTKALTAFVNERYEKGN